MSENERKVWSLIKSLKGCPDTNSPNETMLHKGRSITSNKEKANIFASHYAQISRHNFSKEERNTNRQMKKAMERPTVQDIQL